MKAIFALASIIVLAFSQSSSKGDIGAKKLAKIRTLESQSPNGIIIFTTELYK